MCRVSSLPGVEQWGSRGVLTTTCRSIPNHAALVRACLQADMFASAKSRYDASIEHVTTWDGFMAALSAKHMALAPWADEEAIEEDVKKRSATADAMGAKTLCIPFEQPELPPGTLCFASGKPAKNWALWGRSY